MRVAVIGAYGTNENADVFRPRDRHAGRCRRNSGIAGVEDSVLAEAVWREAIARWPDATIILRQGARVLHDSRRPRVIE